MRILFFLECIFQCNNFFDEYNNFKRKYYITGGARSLIIHGTDNNSYLELGIWTPAGIPTFHVHWVDEFGTDQFNKFIAVDKSLG